MRVIAEFEVLASDDDLARCEIRVAYEDAARVFVFFVVFDARNEIELIFKQGVNYRVILLRRGMTDDVVRLAV